MNCQVLYYDHSLSFKSNFWNVTFRINVVGVHSPSFGFEKNETECQQIVEMIQKTSANVLVVGVGAPKQEKWITQYRQQLTNIGLFMALGAAIDFEAGHKQRAPQIMSNYGLEWLHRLTTEPKRLWRRYLLRDMLFFWLLLQQKFSLNQQRDKS